MKGMVLDIRRGALHDGPGLRTVVFLKGCPLRCRWCHNPEGIASCKQLLFDAPRCADCTACAKACPRHVHRFYETTHTLRRVDCDGCGACAAVCPANALRVAGREMEHTEVLATVLRDAAFYRSSGGGVTLSGGEPAAQIAFTCALLAACKENGIHTCVETSGYANAEIFRRLLPLTDMFLYDCKETDDSRHKALTGVGCERILHNLSMLYEAGASIMLRCPLVPGLNDSPERLEGIAALSRQYPRLLGVEIMPYHPMGADKAKQAGLPELLEMPPADDAQKNHWLETLHALGCTQARLNA